MHGKKVNILTLKGVLCRIKNFSLPGRREVYDTAEVGLIHFERFNTLTAVQQMLGCIIL